jgi:hypothetical protein
MIAGKNEILPEPQPLRQDSYYQIDDQYQWETLFTPIENIENIVDKFLEKEVIKAIRDSPI